MSDNTTSIVSSGNVDPSDNPLRLVLVDAGRVTYHRLPKQGTLLIGRGNSADIRLDGNGASREHARLHVGERIEIEDLGSANGTVVRNQQLEPWTRVVLATAEGVTVGGAVLILQPAELSVERHPSGVRPIRERSLSTIIPKGAVVQDERMRRVYELAGRVAVGDVNVLILGESGSGKELLAETIHRCSSRDGKPFLSLNCAALSEQLLESELFGYERGAFTGASQGKPGLLEAVPGGTLFLDEIGEMLPALQAKLLRALETKEVLRVGGIKPRPIDVRFVSATNRVLADEVTRGRFRRDLYFRLNTVTLNVPPLRERKEEVLALAQHFITTLFFETGHPVEPTLSIAATRALQAHSWPGNVRELKGTIHRALLLCDEQILPEHLVLEILAAPPEPAGLVPSDGQTARSDAAFQSEMAALERRRILEALEKFNGNQTRAAEHLGIARRTLLNRLDEYGVGRPRKRTPPD